MNRKFLGLCIIFLVAVLTMGAVGATNLERHDFDGYFSMDVPEGAAFEKQNSSTYENGIKIDSISYMSDSMVIFYMATPLLSEYSSYSLYQTMFESVNSDLTQCYESQEDNLRILEPTANDTVHFALVGTSSGNKTVLLMGNDVALLKEMGHTIRFNQADR